jgi:ATP/maltotriose-dependent transcriptional regulator MalT
MTKRIKKLKGKAEPKSTFHDAQSEAELRVLANEVSLLRDELPESVTLATEWEMKTAMEMILPAPAPTTNRKPEKPQLVVDFDDIEVY